MEQVNINGVKVMRTINGINFISICALMDYLFDDKLVHYEIAFKGVDKWIKENNALLYSQSGKHTSYQLAFEQARNENKAIVVIENLG